MNWPEGDDQIGSEIAPSVLPAVSPSLQHLTAVELFLADLRIHDVMHLAKPDAQRLATLNVRWILV